MGSPGPATASYLGAAQRRKEGSAGLLRTGTCSGPCGCQAPSPLSCCWSGVGAGLRPDAAFASLGRIAAGPVHRPVVPSSTPSSRVMPCPALSWVLALPVAGEDTPDCAILAPASLRCSLSPPRNWGSKSRAVSTPAGDQAQYHTRVPRLQAPRSPSLPRSKPRRR